MYNRIFQDETRKINMMADACLKAHELVKAHGTVEMEATMRILLFQIGQEIALRESEQRVISNRD